MVLVAILNAGRNAFSFFLLLIVCMGYGVVKPSLGRTMIYVRILAIAHFIFAVVYSITSLSITPDSAGLLVLIVVLPLAGTLTAFYVWTLNSLSATTKDLIERKQKTKALMYKKLWWCILGSIVVIFGFFFLNSFALAGSTAASFVPTHWQMRWFVLDGWLNLVYLFDIGFVAYLWRPTANNRRFAMSDEVRHCFRFLFFCSFGSRIQANDVSSSRKMTTGLRFGPSGVVSMKKTLLKLLPSIPAPVPRADVICRLFLQSLFPRHRSVRRSMTRRYSLWERKRTSGPRMTRTFTTPWKGRGSRVRTKLVARHQPPRGGIPISIIVCEVVGGNFRWWRITSMSRRCLFILYCCRVSLIATACVVVLLPCVSFS